jgi:hypothetical protein
MNTKYRQTDKSVRNMAKWLLCNDLVIREILGLDKPNE